MTNGETPKSNATPTPNTGARPSNPGPEPPNTRPESSIPQPESPNPWSKMAESVQNDPNFFQPSAITRVLQHDISQAQQRLATTMADGYVGADGFIHKSPKKMPTRATDDAAAALAEAKQDYATFQTLLQAHAPQTIMTIMVKKENFTTVIDHFVTDHSAQIDALKTASHNLAKGTPEYTQNVTARRQLAKERSSAMRLAARFFDHTTPDEDGQSKEQTPAGKTREQLDLEAAKQRQEQAAYQKRLDEYWRQKRQNEQKQRMSNERYQEQAHQEQAHQEQIRQTQIHQAQTHQDELNEELEEEMEM